MNVASLRRQELAHQSLWEAWGEKEPPTPAERRALRDAVELLRERDRRVILIALSHSGGRSGDGVACAEEAGLLQCNWVVELARVEETLSWLVPLLHRERANRAEILRGLPEGPIRASVEAYLTSWNTSEAARITGVRQSTAWGRLTRAAKLSPIFSAILHRRA